MCLKAALEIFLQYSYCTWLASEVVQELLRGGVNPVVTVLDCGKAFDKCKFSHLFIRLLNKGLPQVVVRVIAFIYMEQYGLVKGVMQDLVGCPFQMAQGKGLFSPPCSGPYIQTQC